MRTPTRIRRSSRNPRQAAVALSALAFIGLTLAGCYSAPSSPVAAEPAAGAHAVAGSGTSRPEAVAIGDSIAFGKGVLPEESWPAVLAADRHWQLTDLAVSGAGFVKPGWNGTTYRQQVDLALKEHPGVILIAATRNDRDENPALVSANADHMLRELREAFPKAAIIGVAGVWGADEPPATMTRVDEIVGEAVRSVGGTFVDIGHPLGGHPELVQADGVHPDAAGERAVARAIESRLAHLDLAL